MEDYPFIRQLRSPVTDEQLRPLDPRCRRVQFSEPLSDSELKRVAQFMRDYPDVTFRVYGHYLHKCDLEFLRHFDFLRHFAVDIFDLKDFSGINYLPVELESLGLGQTRKQSHSLRFLERFRSLRHLYLEGHKKDIEVLGHLVNLESLALCSVTLPDLSILRPLVRLLSFVLALGGTRNVTLLPEIGRLRYLEIWLVRGLSDLSAIAEIRTLQYLFLQALKRVTVLPSLGRLHLLRRVHIETMKGLNDLQPIADAPNLEDLLVIDMRHLTADALRPFVGHPQLKRATAGLGSMRRNEEARRLLSLPEVDRTEGGFSFI